MAHFPLPLAGEELRARATTTWRRDPESAEWSSSDPPSFPATADPAHPYQRIALYIPHGGKRMAGFYIALGISVAASLAVAIGAIAGVANRHVRAKGTFLPEA
jgi:hypothetical protein